MERQFHTQFFKAELEVCIAKLSRVTQSSRKTTCLFISRFKKKRNMCKIYLPKNRICEYGLKGIGY